MNELFLLHLRHHRVLLVSSKIIPEFHDCLMQSIRSLMATADTTFDYGPLARYVKLRVAHAPGMPGTVCPPPRVSNPDMHHGTCVMHAGIPGACATRNFAYLVRCPLQSITYINEAEIAQHRKYAHGLRFVAVWYWALLHIFLRVTSLSQGQSRNHGKYGYMVVTNPPWFTIWRKQRDWQQHTTYNNYDTLNNLCFDQCENVVAYKSLIWYLLVMYVVKIGISMLG